MSLDVFLYEDEDVGDGDAEELYSANITHNLLRMAEAAGIADALWCPDEHGLHTASQLIPILEDGLFLLKDDPARFEQYNASNGWGLYRHFVPFVEKYLAACKKYPCAKVGVSR